MVEAIERTDSTIMVIPGDELGDNRLKTAFLADDEWQRVLIAQALEGSTPYITVEIEDITLTKGNGPDEYMVKYEGGGDGKAALDVVLMGLLNKKSIWNSSENETMVQAGILFDSGYGMDEVAAFLGIDSDEEKGAVLMPAHLRSNGVAREETGYE